MPLSPENTIDVLKDKDKSEQLAKEQTLEELLKRQEQSCTKMEAQKPFLRFHQPSSGSKRTPTEDEVAERIGTFLGFEQLSSKDKLLLIQLGNLPRNRMVRFDTWRSNSGAPPAYNLHSNPPADAAIITQLKRIFASVDISEGMKQKYGQYIMFGKHNARIDHPRCVKGTRQMWDQTVVCIECEGVLFNPIMDTLAFEHWRDITSCLESCREDLPQLRKIRVYYTPSGAGAFMMDLQNILVSVWELFQHCPKMDMVNIHFVHEQNQAWDIRATIQSPEFVRAFDLSRERIGLKDQYRRDVDAATQSRWIRSMKLSVATALPPDIPSLKWHLQKMYYLQVISRRLKNARLMREEDLDKEVEHLEVLSKQELVESFRFY